MPRLPCVLFLFSALIFYTLVIYEVGIISGMSTAVEIFKELEQ